MKVVSFSQSPYDIPTISPTLKTFKDYFYYVPNNKDSETYQTFKEVEYLYDNCPLHSSILNTLIQEIYGTGLIPGNKIDENIIRKYKLDKLLIKVIYDYVLFGGGYIEIIWNAEHTAILEMKHIPYNQIRLGNFKKEQNDEIEIFFHCQDWSTWKKKEITPLVRFNTKENSADHQILPIFYNEFKIYPIPYYYALFNDIYTTIDLSRFYKDLIANDFSPNTFITIPGILEQEQEEQLRIVFDNKMKGPNGFKNILFNPETPEGKPIIEKVSNQDDGAKYHDWNALFENKLIQGHQVTTPILFGIKTEGQLGGTEELKIGYDIYKQRKVYPMRNKILQSFEDINEYFIDSLSQIKIEDLQILQNNTETNGTI
jgi:hypothetical protein